MIDEYFDEFTYVEVQNSILRIVVNFVLGVFDHEVSFILYELHVRFTWLRSSGIDF